MHPGYENGCIVDCEEYGAIPSSTGIAYYGRQHCSVYLRQGAGRPGHHDAESRHHFLTVYLDTVAATTIPIVARSARGVRVKLPCGAKVIYSQEATN
jgi:hypothetical protein